MLTETLDTLRGQGFRRFLVVNGHGGNTPARDAVEETGARWHDWWDSPAVREVAAEIYPGDATHASWFEAFPWTKLAGVELPAEEKPMVTDREALRELEPAAVREAVGDGSYGGPYAVADEDALRVWAAGVSEVRALIESPLGTDPEGVQPRGRPGGPIVPPGSGTCGARPSEITPRTTSRANLPCCCRRRSAAAGSAYRR